MPARRYCQDSGPRRPAPEPEATLYTAANALTLLRLLLLPVVIVLVLHSVTGASGAAAAVFLVAALTDFLDGQVARRTGTVTEAGKLFDPFVDRVFISGTIIALVIAGRLPLAGVALVVARDIILILGYKSLRSRGVVVRVSLLGKSYTALIMLAIVLSLANIGPWQWLFWAGVAGSLLSGVAYIVKGVSRLRRQDAV